MIERRLREIMSAVLDVGPETLDEASSVETVESWDSLHHMNLMLSLEDEFGVRFSDEEIPVLTSFPALRDALERMVPRASAS